MGTLYIVATPIGNLADMTPRAIEVLRKVDLIAAEDTRHTGRLLKHFDIFTPMVSYHHYNRAARTEQLRQYLEAGDVALVSDAGTPAIADPGHELVADAVAAGHPVVPIPGASALLAAVSAAGLTPGPFVFLGFLPRQGAERRSMLIRALSTPWPIVLFESPLRIVGALRDIEAVAPGREGVVARELTKLYEEFLRGTLRSLIDQLSASPPRGEVVLVVGGAVNGVDTPDDHRDRVVRAVLDRGAKPSRAAREVADILNIDSAEAYELVRRIGSERSASDEPGS